MNNPQPHGPQPDDPQSDDSQVAADLEDAMLDVLLQEVLADQNPPDLSRKILHRLHDVPNRPITRKTTTSRNRSKSVWSKLLLIAAAALLAVGAGFGIRYRDQIGITGKPVMPMAKNTDAISSPGFLAASKNDSGDQARISAADAATRGGDKGRRLPSRRIELAESSHNDGTGSPVAAIGIFSRDEQSGTKDAASPPPPQREVTLVSRSLSDHMQRYWDRVAVEPADLLSPEETIERLRARFQIDVPVAAVDDPELMLVAIGQPSNSQALAVPILAAISARPVESLDRRVDQQMIGQISETLRAGGRFDHLYASWFERNDSTEEPNTSPIGELLKPLGQHESLVVTAAVALNADIRCQRCHDVDQGAMPNDPLLSQHDYWQFAATVAPWLSLQPTTQAGWFYDTADGVRRLAEPDATANWPDRLLGSRELAQGLVGAMWTMVHGRPIASSPYDLAGSAQDQDLQKLREELADDLLASDFNLLRTISLMLTDSTVRRGTPSAMTPSGVLTASDEQWEKAVAAVESFAASPPMSLPSTRGQRMQLVQRSDLPTLLGTAGATAILAQPLGTDTLERADDSDSESNSSSTQQAAAKELAPAVLAGLPMRATLVMPAWIVELPDFESRLRHVSHLAGLASIPEPAFELATKMKAAGVDESLILQRIWWIIRPQG